MARAVTQDFLHSMRFFVSVSGTPAGTGLGGNTAPETGGALAGFATCSTPEITVAPATYKEGTWVYGRKQPGNPSVNDVTLTRGVAMNDSSLWGWLKVVIEGQGGYRGDVTIQHFTRSNFLTGGSAPLTQTPQTSTGVTAAAARTYVLHEAFPVNHKVASDLDANSNEISIMSLGIAYEYFELQETQID